MDRPVQKALAATEVRKEGEVGGLMGEMEIGEIRDLQDLRDLRDKSRPRKRWRPR